ncbi:hypothetical protein EYF80_038610 [Liparis tanakae]|uniref:Uncharacterized protein n=1 Tax=Liparis tanakae TaxID=230148 RepID=A0A4Z2GEU3_9TELE|nr:hypothetical protein EYF80_038610 [Liparis tanakae]
MRGSNKASDAACVLASVHRPRQTASELPRVTEERPEQGVSEALSWSRGIPPLKPPGKDLCTVTQRAEGTRADKA